MPFWYWIQPKKKIYITIEGPVVKLTVNRIYRLLFVKTMDILEKLFQQKQHKKNCKFIGILLQTGKIERKRNTQKSKWKINEIWETTTIWLIVIAAVGCLIQIHINLSMSFFIFFFELNRYILCPLCSTPTVMRPKKNCRLWSSVAPFFLQKK